MNLWCIVPFHNGPDLLRACLQSIAEQDDGLRVVVADDCSTDEAVIPVYRRFCEREGWQWLRTPENVGALQNIRQAILHLEETEDFDADDVILLVDGDDRLLPGAVPRIREAFRGDALVVYGSYVASPPDPDCPPARPLPPDILRFGMVRAFTRDHGSWWNHPYAFRRRVYDVLRDEDFTMDGEPIRHCYDTALMVPMLEAAGERVEFIPDPIYEYNSARPTSVHRVHLDVANRENEWIVNQPRKYQGVGES